jgi:hypothetical protein
VKAFDQLLIDLPLVIERELIGKINGEITDKETGKKREIRYELGSIPNFHSLIPISQTAHKPIFDLEYRDGVVGAHFSKVEEFYQIIHQISTRLLENVEAMS